MEIRATHFIFLVPIVGMIFAIVFFLKIRHLYGKNLPPGSFGWSLMGETMGFLYERPERFVLSRMKKHSSAIFKTNILGENTVVLCGPDGNKFVFSNEEKLFTAFRPHSMQKLFRSYKTSSSSPNPTREEESKTLRSPGFLKPEALVRYLGVMDSITQQQMEGFWEGREMVEVFPLAKTLTLSLACRFFLGVGDLKRIAKLVSSFDDISLGMHSIPLNFPGTSFNKASKAATYIRKELRAVIEEKKAAIASGAPPGDILSFMIVTTDSSGKHMPEAEIADKVMGLLVAGYSTVATAMTFFMMYVGRRQDIYARILAEQTEVREAKQKGELLQWNDVQKMKYSWSVVYEVMRLTPPLQGTFREALTEFTYAGFTVPKGWKVYWTVSTTSRNPNFFPDPEKLDPSRYEEGKALPPYTFMPFGGGARMCPGKEYARLAILTFVHNVVKRFKWQLVHPKEKIIGDMMPTPQHGLPIRLQSNC